MARARVRSNHAVSGAVSGPASAARRLTGEGGASHGWGPGLDHLGVAVDEGGVVQALDREHVGDGELGHALEVLGVGGQALGVGGRAGLHVPGDPEGGAGGDALEVRGVPTMSSMVESAVRVGNSNSPKAGTEGIEGISIPASPAIVDATIQDGMSGNPGKVGSDGSDAGLNAGTPGKVGMVKPEKPCAEAPATTAAAATAAPM